MERGMYNNFPGYQMLGQPCPLCGTCPHCGRGYGLQIWPYSPTWTYTGATGGTLNQPQDFYCQGAAATTNG